MKIKYKSITHERTEDAPFVGALICANNCKFNCKGCFNQEIKKLPTLINTSEKIIAEVKSNPFNQGIILAGLEWTLQPQELIELASLASKNGLQVMIYTGLDLPDFQKVIGKSCADKVGYKKQLEENILSDSDDGIYTFIGGMVLDYMINGEYYIKCGKYDETKLSPERENFGVKLASENQVIYKFVKRED